MFDPTTDSINLAFQQGTDGITVSSVKPGEDLPGLVVRSGDAIISREFRSDTRVPEQNRNRMPKNVGGACIPLQSNENVIGVLCINVKLPAKLTAVSSGY